MRIALYNSPGTFAIVDAEDYPRLSVYKWRLHKGYAQTTYGKHTYLLHREVLSVSGTTTIVDHINRDKLDCRSSNLRFCESWQNRANISASKNNKLGIKGVVYRPKNSDRPYAAFAYRDGEQYYLGTYKTIEEASDAYDKKAIELFGDFAYTNSMSNNKNRG